MEKNKELTPMMELIEMCEILMRNSTNNLVYETANIIKFRAEKELLPKEKQVIEDAFIDGNCNCGRILDYYNTKYNNQIK